MELKKSMVELNGGAMLGHCQELSVQFDQHKIVHVQKLVSHFPHELHMSREEEITGRKKFSAQLSQKENQIM